MVEEGGKLRLDFKLTDGGEFDADGKVDGVITDPGAAGIGVLLTGSSLVAATQTSTDIDLNAVLQATLAARLQQLLDSGTYSALAAAVVIQAFSTDIRTLVNASGGTGAFVGHVAAMVTAIEDNTDLPGFGASPLVSLIGQPDAMAEAVTLLG